MIFLLDGNPLLSQPCFLLLFFLAGAWAKLQKEETDKSEVSAPGFFVQKIHLDVIQA